MLFRGSIAENIAKGRAEFGDRQVMTMEEVLHNYSVNKNKPTSTTTPAGDKAVAVADEESGGLYDANGAVDADIIDAAKASNAHDFISTFSEQYHTDVGESSIMVRVYVMYLSNNIFVTLILKLFYSLR